MDLSYLSLGKIIWVDILLSGDNAIVIAAACAALPGRQRFIAMVLGTILAVALRVALTGSAAYLMTVPYLKLCGGFALMLIAVKLLKPDGDEGGGPLGVHFGLGAAILAVVIADISMSIDNVLAVAAVANGDMLLVALGLLLSIPIMIGAASIISAFINKFPILIWAGAGFLGWVAGELIASDSYASDISRLVAFCCALIVLFVGAIWRSALPAKIGARS